MDNKEILITNQISIEDIEKNIVCHSLSNKGFTDEKHRVIVALKNGVVALELNEIDQQVIDKNSLAKAINKKAIKIIQ